MWHWQTWHNQASHALFNTHQSVFQNEVASQGQNKVYCEIKHLWQMGLHTIFKIPPPNIEIKTNNVLRYVNTACFRGLYTCINVYTFSHYHLNSRCIPFDVGKNVYPHLLR